MFLGWYDPDKKRPVPDKLAEAVERYVEKFGSDPEICLTSAADAAALDGQTDLPVRAVTFISRHTFYVGVEEPEVLDIAA
jgi:hypothetical protein